VIVVEDCKLSCDKLFSFPISKFKCTVCPLYKNLKAASPIVVTVCGITKVVASSLFYNLKLP
jgi:hypothetical protein